MYPIEMRKAPLHIPTMNCLSTNLSYGTTEVLVFHKFGFEGAISITLDGRQRITYNLAGSSQESVTGSGPFSSPGAYRYIDGMEA